MKKALSILAVITAILLTLGVVSKHTQANRIIFGTGSADELETAKRISLDILRERAVGASIGNPDDFVVKRVEIDDLHMAHTHFQQVFNGIPVWGGEIIVHLRADGELFTITDDLRESIAVNTTPNYSKEEAIQFALAMYSDASRLTSAPLADLWIYRGDTRDHLAYRVRLDRQDGTKHTAMPVIFIDAHTGEKVFEYNNLQTGTGSSLYSGTVTIGTNQSGTSYFMENLTRLVGTFNYNNGTSSPTRFSDADDIWNSSVQRAGVDAQYGMEAMMNYLQNVHGRNGIDGNGGPRISTGGSTAVIQSRVHYSTNYNNAFWNGSYMTYGDGNGSTFSPLVTIDICGHEMMHGVTERTAGLVYSNESGALNESMSDVFGTMVERYARPSNWNWKIGEDAYTPGNGNSDALRYMDNPHLAPNSGYTADDDPDHYAERYTGSADNGGVHINSGIGNHVFYRVSEGGTHHRSGVTVTGIGPDDAARIWYRALTSYMTSNTNFSGARTATLNAANAIFGSASTQYNTVATAWCSAGVGTCPSGTPTPTPTATATVAPSPTPTATVAPSPTPTVVPTPPPGNLLVNGGFENSVSPWIGSGSGFFYTNNGNYPHGGTGYVYMGVNNSVSGQVYQTVSIPANAAGTLTFWLNVTSSETTTVTPYDRLFLEVRSTSGALLATLATYSNLNKTTAGNYTLRTLNMAAYRGQTVRLQFRCTMDYSLTTTFRIDDASLQ